MILKQLKAVTDRRSVSGLTIGLAFSHDNIHGHAYGADGQQSLTQSQLVTRHWLKHKTTLPRPLQHSARCRIPSLVISRYEDLGSRHLSLQLRSVT
jgi:hypothetical protein